MRKKMLIGVAVLAAVVLVFGVVVAMQPSEFRVTRSAKISAAPPAVFEHVNDFHKWDAWSPWAELDPNAKHSFDGPSEGEGAKFHWSGNDKIGEGSMTLVESRPSELIRIKLEFIRPFQDKSDVEFTFKPEEEQTFVSWSMFGHKNFFSKAICMFMNMDKMLGGDFEKGLAKLKTVVESTPTAESAPETEKSEPSVTSES